MECSTKCGGECCRSFFLSSSIRDFLLWARDENGEIQEEYKKVADMLILIKQIGYFTYEYTCKHYDVKTSNCKIYNDRPKMCRNYPDIHSSNKKRVCTKQSCTGEFRMLQLPEKSTCGVGIEDNPDRSWYEKYIEDLYCERRCLPIRGDYAVNKPS